MNHIAGPAYRPKFSRQGRTRALLLLPLLLLMGSMLACESDPELPPVPSISGVDKTLVAPGDTLVVTGSDFPLTTSEIRVFIGNPLGGAIPFEGNTARLTIVVPQDATTGKLWVTVPDQPERGVGPRVEVRHPVGDVWVYGGVGSANPLKMEAPDANAQFLVIPHFTKSNAATEFRRFTIVSDDSDAYPSPPANNPSATRTDGGTMGIRESFEAVRWNIGEELLSRGSAKKFTPVERVAAPPDPVRNFFVLNTVSACFSPSCFTEITALLKYEGAHCLIYADVDTLTTGNFTQQHFDDFGTSYDTQIRPTNTSAFGTESDIDGNGQVIIIISPVVNRLTPPGSGAFIGGYFLQYDLDSPGSNGVQPGMTNEAEIFYVLAADPNAFWGNTFSLPFLAAENLQTIAHEYEHLISFSHRKFNEGGRTQTLWLEEGMAHVAEDLNGWNASNVKRANLWLAAPGNTSLEHPNAPLQQRGGMYLFLRYLGDRFGDEIFKTILQSPCGGRACIESITGENFYRTVGDFLATIWLSGKGINDDPKFNFQSIDFLNDFNGVQTVATDVGAGNESDLMQRTTGKFILYSNPTPPASKFTFTGTANSGQRATVVRIR